MVFVKSITASLFMVKKSTNGKSDVSCTWSQAVRPRTKSIKSSRIPQTMMYAKIVHFFQVSNEFICLKRFRRRWSFRVPK